MPANTQSSGVETDGYRQHTTLYTRVGSVETFQNHTMSRYMDQIKMRAMHPTRRPACGANLRCPLISGTGTWKGLVHVHVRAKKEEENIRVL